MIYRWQCWLFAVSSPLRVCLALLVTVLFALCFGVYLVPAFTMHMAGMMPIDLVFPVTPEAIRLHVSSYDDTARRLYAQFLFIDCLYPPTLALFLSLWWSRLLRSSQVTSKWRYLVLLPWLAALLDLTENAGFAGLIWSYPMVWPTVEIAVGLVRAVKLAVLSSCLLISMALLIYRARNR